MVEVRERDASMFCDTCTEAALIDPSTVYDQKCIFDEMYLRKAKQHQNLRNLRNVKIKKVWSSKYILGRASITFDTLALLAAM